MPNFTEGPEPRHLTYEDYDRLILEAATECRRLSDERAPFTERKAARDRMFALKDDCEDIYGRNPGHNPASLPRTR